MIPLHQHIVGNLCLDHPQTHLYHHLGLWMWLRLSENERKSMITMLLMLLLLMIMREGEGKDWDGRGEKMEEGGEGESNLHQNTFL